MKTTRTMLLAVTVWLTAAAALFAANPHLGTWKLNEGKSKLVGGTKNNTVSYTEAKNGMIKLTVEGVDKDGKATHWTWEGKFDGKSYKAKGNSEFDMLALKPVNDRTNSLTGTKNGKMVATGTITVAKDGKSRVVTTTGTDANGKKVSEKAYYDKE
jgi:hypothetical protein